MKKVAPAASSAPPLGPLAAEPSREDSRPTEAQAVVLEALQRIAHAATLAELTDATALHINTLRGHLSALEDAGLLRKGTLAPSGRGRPAVVYEALPRTADPASREYAGLATTLASALRRLSPQPAADAIVAGREWGRDLATSSAVPSPTRPLQRRRAVVNLLEQLRFSPRANAAVQSVQLTRCPLLEAAHEQPEIVCNIHRGVVEGMLEAWDDTSTTVELRPFSEPGACLLLLSPQLDDHDA